MTTGLVLLGVLATVSTQQVAAHWAAADPQQPKTVQVTAERFKYEPSEVTIRKGEPVVLIVKSIDVPHGLRFRELNLQAQVSKGGTAEIKFTPDRTGDFVGHCSVFCGSGHGAMTLTIHVTE